MRKVLVVAVREYNAAVRSKAFIIGLLMMPLLMGASILVQVLTADRDRQYAIIDRSQSGLFPIIEQTFALYNSTYRLDPDTKKEVGPKIIVTEVKPSANDPAAIQQQRLDLSNRVRKGELAGFVEIGAEAISNPPPTPEAGKEADRVDDRRLVRLQTNLTQAGNFGHFLSHALTAACLQRRLAALGAQLPEPQRQVLQLASLKGLIRQIDISPRGLSRVDPSTGEIGEDVGISRAAPFIVPFALVMLMFMVVMMGATPLMQGVVEEKMNRVAEVLLGSVPPFQLMLGKLLGMTAVSLTAATVYLGGAYWAAHHFNFTRFVQYDLLLWFVLFQVLASLMYGSLFIGIGAACSDMKETQNLLWPVILLVCMPLFVLGQVLEKPNGDLATWLSFFPFATPMLMTARQAIPPGVPLWQVVLGVLVVLVTMTACVWAAGRIFRVGLLLQGKGADLRQLVRWVVRG